MAQNNLERLLGLGMQPGALERLMQKMQEVRGMRPINPIQPGYKGNLNALSTQPRMKGPMSR